MIIKMLINEPSPTYPPVTKTVYRANERVKFSDILPHPPAAGALPRSDRRGARARGHAARPPARFSSLLSSQPHNQKPKRKPCASRTVRQKYQICFRT